MTTVPRRIHKRELAEVVAMMPDVSMLDIGGEEPADLLIVVLGFEDRSLAVPKKFATNGTKVDSTAVIKYQTNEGDNERNWTALEQILQSICSSDPVLLRAGQSLAHDLRGLIGLYNDTVRVVLDVSVASNDVIVEALGALLDLSIDLTIVYAEADEYRPTKEEFEMERQRFVESGQMGLDDGVLDVAVSGEYNGVHSPNLPDSLVIFPGFSRDRVRSVISQIDGDWIVAPEVAALVWMVGLPPHSDLVWRRDALHAIHELDSGEDRDIHDVSTFDYRETLRALDDTYRSSNHEVNLAIAALGSKMQAVGIALFCCARPDVSVLLARPRIYNAGSYTRGVRNVWQLTLGSTSQLSKQLRMVGTLELVESDKGASPTAESM
jgi:hypothetical protein